MPGTVLNILLKESHLILITLPGKMGPIITITKMKTYPFIHQLFIECLLGTKAVLGTGVIMATSTAS